MSFWKKVMVAALSSPIECWAPTSYCTDFSGFKLALPRSGKDADDTEVSLE